ncbi:MAG: hypothetical protein EBW87_01090 [Burkholderiaceae bacterium]|nr:hypothetical protein [Burkholderiaceae bacterium]
MSEETPQFSVTFRDNKNNASLTVNYDSDIEFRRGCVSLANAILTLGLVRVVAIGQEFVQSQKG